MQTIKKVVGDTVDMFKNPDVSRDKLSTTSNVKYSNETMTACEWHGKEDMRINTERPKPMVNEPHDAVIRVTATTVCGSDLHLYLNELPSVCPIIAGDILGHECMGIVEDVGDAITEFKRGDRVVVSAVIADGTCSYCKSGMPSLCDTTNPSSECEKNYGHRTAGLFGYSRLTGGYDGGQAEYIRVPFADFNLLKVHASVPDEKALFLSDIIATGWHANELAEVREGDNVCIWGAGPVGLMAAKWALFRKARRVLVIDHEPYRLEVARKIGCETLDYNDKDPYVEVPKLMIGGPDRCIDCVGFRFAKTISHRIQRALHLEGDALDVVDEMVTLCRKGGNIALIGDYFGRGNRFPIGAMMEKAITVRGGQLYVQKYWKELLGYIEEGKFDPTFAITHRFKLEETPKVYKMFNAHADNIIKPFIKVGKPASEE